MALNKNLFPTEIKAISQVGVFVTLHLRPQDSFSSTFCFFSLQTENEAVTMNVCSN